MNQKVLFLEEGIAMAVSDFQGNLEDFNQVYLIYSTLKKNKMVKYLLICGDLIHGYPGYEDKSYELINRVMSLKKEDSDIIHLLGNHELVHLMHWNLEKGQIKFTESFENKIINQREEIWNYLNTLPIACISKGGILINHTGISAAIGGQKNEKWDLFLKINPIHLWLNNLDFSREFPKLKKEKSKFNPKLGDEILNTPQGAILWEIFMNKNELVYKKKDYVKYLENTLENFSKLYPCHILVSSHIEEKKGFKIINEKHLRICTSYGANENKDKKYLLFNTAINYENTNLLETKLRNLWL